MLRPKSFDVCINATVLIIAMLGYSEVDIEVLGIGIETIESDDCREVLENNRDTNDVLAMM